MLPHAGTYGRRRKNHKGKRLGASPAAVNVRHFSIFFQVIAYSAPHFEAIERAAVVAVGYIKWTMDFSDSHGYTFRPFFLLRFV